MRRVAGAVLAAAGLAWFLPAQIVKQSPSTPNIQEELGVSILMHDGVRLAADVFHPQNNARWPAVLVRTPYNRKNPSSQSYRFFLRHGYAVVIEDVRGKYASQGVFGAISQEGPDANDTINWIAAQPWSDGHVAMAGSSYLGITTWWAAVEQNPHLIAIAAMNAGNDEYLDRFYSVGGALKLGHRLLWIAQNFHPPSQKPPPFASYIFHLPLRTADIAATGRVIPMWRDAIDHPAYDGYWDQFSIRQMIKKVNIPVSSLGGWFDNYAESELDSFTRLSRQHTPVETSIGPWAHDPSYRFPSRDFGRDAIPHVRDWQLSWFDRWLKPEPRPTHFAPLPRLHIFVMGPDRWREEHEWPLARTVYTTYFLDSAGHANTASGDGALSLLKPRGKQDTFTYDPKNPVPTIGGNICCDPKTLPPGPLDQRPDERRPDVLVYTSAPLQTDTEVTGPIKVNLFCSTSANDTDFTAKLVDVYPDGRALGVTDGVLRLRYRLSLDKPVFVKKNGKYDITIDAGVTSWVFPAGHRLRLDISSSNFPHFDRNLNSTKRNADETKLNKAKQTIFHSSDMRSAVILPVIPASGSAAPAP